MAKRKAARATGRKRAGRRAAVGRSRSRATGAARKSARTRRSAGLSKKSAARRSAVRKSAVRKSPVRKSPVRKSSARKSPVRKSPVRKSPVRKSSARKSSVRKSPVRKSPVRKSSARKSSVRKSPVRKSPVRKSPVRKSPVRKSPARKSPVRKSPARKNVRKIARTKATVQRSPAHGARSVRSGRPIVTLASVRKVPALNRERRIVSDDDFLPTPPSSLDLDQTASSARTGRHELDERLHDHTETGPALTGGDVDADWEGAYTSGDEAPGGDNPYARSVHRRRHRKGARRQLREQRGTEGRGEDRRS